MTINRSARILLLSYPALLRVKPMRKGSFFAADPHQSQTGQGLRAVLRFLGELG